MKWFQAKVKDFFLAIYHCVIFCTSYKAVFKTISSNTKGRRDYSPMFNWLWIAVWHFFIFETPSLSCNKQCVFLNTFSQKVLLFSLFSVVCVHFTGPITSEGKQIGRAHV